MKKIVFLLLFISYGLFAQDKKHERIEALKTAFITEKLDLSATDAEQFWPVYKSYEKRFKTVRTQRRQEVYKVIRDRWENLSDAEADALIARYFDLEFQELQLQKERNLGLRKIMSPKKIIILKKAEEDFKQELLKRYRAKHGNNE